MEYQANLALEYGMKQVKANKIVPRECTHHSKCPLQRTQEKTLHMDIARWSKITKIRLIIFFGAKDGEALYIQKKTRPGAESGSDHELLIAKLRLKLKKVGKATGPLRYNLNQISYDYTVEVRNIFQGLDLIGRLPDELSMEVRDIVQETGIKTIPKKKKCKKSKMAL